MSTINEEIVTGRKFRKLVDEAAKLWQRISFWTKASDVEFNDGNNAETKLAAIDGITDSLNATNSNIALSAKAGQKLAGQLGGLSLIRLSQNEYDSMEFHDPNTLYFIYE